MAVTVHRFERRDPRLGRNVAHDDASRPYDLAKTFGVSIPTKPINWYRADADVFDQGDNIGKNIGCCTAATALGLLLTAPFRKPGRIFNMRDVLDFYSEETRTDEFPGEFPPDDTGSSTLAAMRVLKARGYATAYRHAFSPASALAALNHGPIAVGSIWTESMFSVSRDNTIVVDRRSPVAGGHEYIADGWDPTTRRVRITNSWGLSWGESGRAWLRYSDFAWLLSQRGDVAQPAVA